MSRSGQPEFRTDGVMNPTWITEESLVDKRETRLSGPTGGATESPFSDQPDGPAPAHGSRPLTNDPSGAGLTSSGGPAN